MYKVLAKIINDNIKQSYDYECNFSKEELDSLIDIARRNHIEFMVYSTLLKNKTLEDCYYNFLQSGVKRGLLVSLIQSTELNRIVNEFEKSGIKNMPLKGAILKSIYPRAEMREMSDIDILIFSEDFAASDKSFCDLGYTLKSSIKHHDIYIKQPYMTVEAHRALYDKTVDRNQYTYFLEASRAVLSEGFKYKYEFSKEDFYIYMIAHAAKHFYAMGCGIRNLIDIYVFLSEYNSSMDMKYVENELEKCGIRDFEENLRRLAFDWLDENDLDEFEEKLFQYMLDAGIYGKDENGIWNKFCDREKGSISKIELKMWYLFPPLYYMGEYYPWIEERPFLLPVAWFVRLFVAIVCGKGKNKRNMIKGIANDRIADYKQIYQRVNLKFSGIRY